MIPRCDNRVDKMMERGMLKELEDYHAHYNSVRGAPADYTVGIFQSIGFKEFHSYLKMTGEEKRSDAGREALSAGVKQMKLATRQYSRRQAKWMRNRFLSKWRATPPVYAVDSTEAEKWSEVRVFDAESCHTYSIRKPFASELFRPCRKNRGLRSFRGLSGAVAFAPSGEAAPGKHGRDSPLRRVRQRHEGRGAVQSAPRGK